MTKSALLASAAFALSVAVPAIAQEAVPPAATAQAGAADARDEEIIVTATRRAEALSDVPIAVSALTAEQLDNSGVTDIRALNQLAPSLIVSGATSEVNFTARIRGVGTVGENPGLESSVALFIDGVYRSRTGVGLSELGGLLQPARCSSCEGRGASAQGTRSAASHVLKWEGGPASRVRVV